MLKDMRLKESITKTVKVMTKLRNILKKRSRLNVAIAINQYKGNDYAVLELTKNKNELWPLSGEK